MTREFKGTPGPWVSVDYCGKLQIQTGKYYGDADILDKEDVGEEVAEANASLIESSTDLLLACQEALKELEFHNWHNTKTGFLLNNAINKALGNDWTRKTAEDRNCIPLRAYNI